MGNRISNNLTHLIEKYICVCAYVYMLPNMYMTYYGTKLSVNKRFP